MTPADPYEVIDCAGVILCNDDIADSCAWDPPQGEPERVPFLCDWPKVEAARACVVGAGR